MYTTDNSLLVHQLSYVHKWLQMHKPQLPSTLNLNILVKASFDDNRLNTSTKSDGYQSIQSIILMMFVRHSVNRH